MILRVAGFMFLAIGHAVLAAQPPNPAEFNVEQLIRDLGNNNYAVRERADAALRKLGAAAIAVLEKALETDDAEVRMRLKAILADARLGISADMPPETADILRNFDKALGQAERPKAIAQIVATLGEKAVPFLIQRLTTDVESEETQAALQGLRHLASDAVAARVIESVKNPRLPALCKALAWALAHQGRLAEALTVLSPLDPPDNAPSELVDKAVAALLSQLKSGQFEDAAKESEPLCKALPEDARFFYLRAMALRGLKKDNEANAAEKFALGLRPTDETQHAALAQWLEALGQKELSIREHERVLAIPPESIHDMNACWRVGEWNQKMGNYDKAADLMEQGLEYYRRFRRDHPHINLGNWTEEKMQAHAKYLREYARGEHRASGELGVAVLVKDGKAEEMHQALRQCIGGWTFQVLPHGIRLLDEQGATLEYDPKAHELYMTLRGRRMQPAVSIQLKEPKSRVGVNLLDCFYVFEVDSKTGEAVKLARYERDYVVTFKPSETLLALKEVTLQINEEAADWQQLLNGKTFDYLPQQLRLHIEGVTPEGKRGIYQMTLEVDAARLNGVVTGNTEK
jgi:tetratricopeptide (TPR) repeat protein